MPPAHSDWIAHVFDHPIAEPAWHWSSDAPRWDGSEADTAAFLAEMGERSGQLLARFTDAQLNQGFWYLLSPSCSSFLFSLVAPEVPLPGRLRALRSFLPLFQQVMAVRCSPHLSHLDEQPASPLNSACYMWWDLIPIHGRPDLPERAAVDAEVLRLLPRLLAIPHDACRESALHGIGHWQIYYPELTSVVDDFLERAPRLRPELVAYARAAREGAIL